MLIQKRSIYLMSLLLGLHSLVACGEGEEEDKDDPGAEMGSDGPGGRESGSGGTGGSEEDSQGEKKPIRQTRELSKEEARVVCNYMTDLIDNALTEENFCKQMRWSRVMREHDSAEALTQACESGEAACRTLYSSFRELQFERRCKYQGKPPDCFVGLPELIRCAEDLVERDAELMSQLPNDCSVYDFSLREKILGQYSSYSEKSQEPSGPCGVLMEHCPDYWDIFMN